MTLVHLIVCLLRAKDLPNADFDEHFGQAASDPYAGIFVGNESCYSTPVHDDAHPIIQKCCDFGEQSHDARINVAIADADILDADDILGSVCATASQAGLAQGDSSWLQLNRPPTVDQHAFGNEQQTLSAGSALLRVIRLPAATASSGNSPASEDDDPFKLHVETVWKGNALGVASADAICPTGTALVGCGCSLSANATIFDDARRAGQAGVADSFRCVGAHARHADPLTGDPETSGSSVCTASSDVDAAAARELGFISPPKHSVFAWARCLHMPDEGVWPTRPTREAWLQGASLPAVPPGSDGVVFADATSASSSSIGDASIVQCPGAAKDGILSCTAFATTSSVGVRTLGVLMDPGSEDSTSHNERNSEACQAYIGRGDLGSTVRAQALCVPRNIDDVLIVHMHSGVTMDPVATAQSVTCPDGFALAGCGCYSANGNCVGAEPAQDDLTCTAQLKMSGLPFSAGGRAVATCLYRSRRGEQITEWAAETGFPEGGTQCIISHAELTERLGSHSWMGDSLKGAIGGGGGRASGAGHGGGGGGNGLLLFILGMTTCGLLALLPRMWRSERATALRDRFMKASHASGPRVMLPGAVGGGTNAAGSMNVSMIGAQAAVGTYESPAPVTSSSSTV